MRDFTRHQYEFELSGVNGELELLPYEFSPSYMEKDHAQMMRLRSRVISAILRVMIVRMK
jgi:hypothetical protein